MKKGEIHAPVIILIVLPIMFIIIC